MDAQTLKIIGEIFGALAVIEGFFIYYCATREKILVCKFVSDLLWVINYVCLGAPTAVILNAVGMIREAVFYNRDKRAFAKSILWPILFVCISIASPIYSLISGSEGLYALLPAAGTSLAVLAFYSRRPEHTRAMGFFAQLLWLIYSIFILNYSAIVCNATLMASAVVGTLRARINKKRKEGADVQ